MYNEMTYFNSVVEKVEDLLPLIDKWGGPDTFPHMAAGWAAAFDAPFTWTKQVASTSAAPATARSYTGRRASTRRAACAASSRTSSTSLPRSWRPPVCRNPRSSMAHHRRRLRGPASSTPSTMRRHRAHDTVFRDVRQSGDLSRGLAGPHHPPRGMATTNCRR